MTELTAAERAAIVALAVSWADDNMGLDIKDWYALPGWVREAAVGTLAVGPTT